MHAGELPFTAAIRELAEESGIVVPESAPAGEYTLDHGGWTYTTFVLAADQRYASSVHHEQVTTRWVPTVDVETLPLHPGFAESWADVRLLLE